MNICHADSCGVMVWGTLSKPTVLFIRDNEFNFAQFEDQAALDSWIAGMDDFIGYDVDKLGANPRGYTLSKEAQLYLQKIKRILPDCAEDQIIERALEMMAAYWKK